MARNEIEVVLRAKDNVSKQLDAVDARTKKFGASFASVAKGVGVAAAAIGAAMAGAAALIGKAAISAASDFEEVQSKFSVVFRGVEDRAQETIERLTEGFGFSRKSVLEWLSTIQDTLVPMGLARDAAADMSGAITELAIDIGSFNNQPTADVIRDIQSALVGNHETVRKYGIVITEAMLKQEALTSGIIDSKRELTAQEKLLTRYNLIVKGSGDAVGDFARTSEGWANQSRITRERLDELATTLGVPLIDALTDLQPEMRNVIDFTTDWIDANSDLIEQDMAEVVAGITEGIHELPGLARDIAVGFNLVQAARALLLTTDIEAFRDAMRDIRALEGRETMEDVFLRADKAGKRYATNIKGIVEPTIDDLIGMFGEELPDALDATNKKTEAQITATRTLTTEFEKQLKAVREARDVDVTLEPRLLPRRPSEAGPLFVPEPEGPGALERAGDSVTGLEEQLERISEDIGPNINAMFDRMTDSMVQAAFQGRTLREIMQSLGTAIQVHIVQGLVKMILNMKVFSNQSKSILDIFANIGRKLLSFLTFGIFGSEGGLVGGSRGGIIGMQSGGLVPNLPTPGFQPVGTDRVVAALTPGELVLSRHDTAQLVGTLSNVADALKRPISGRAQSGGITSNIDASTHGNLVFVDDNSIRNLADRLNDAERRRAIHLRASVARGVE